MLKRLETIRNDNFDFHHPSRYAAPAAIAQVLAFTNGAVGSRIPGNSSWRQALHDDPVINLLLDIVANPALGQF